MSRNQIKGLPNATINECSVRKIVSKLSLSEGSDNCKIVISRIKTVRMEGVSEKK